MAPANLVDITFECEQPQTKLPTETHAAGSHGPFPQFCCLG